MSFMPAGRVSPVPKQLHPAPVSQHQPWDSCSLQQGQDSGMLSNPNEPGLHRYPRSTLNLKQGISKKADWQLLFSQSRVLDCQGTRKEQKPAPQHFKAACKTSCVSKFQTDCSHMQTCPKELHKACLSIHPKHIKFLLQEHMLGSLEAPHIQPTQATKPPRIPGVTHKNLLLQKHKR